MRYAQIRDMDIVNGKGIAVSVFFQGCSHHCKNCFNKSTWDFKSGIKWDNDIENKFIQMCNKDYISCISFLGGEPLDQPISELVTLLIRIKKEVNKPIYMWSGYTWEEILRDKKRSQILNYIDILIDGKFIDELKDMNLKLRGSSNQRIIDVKKSLDKENLVCLDH